MSMIPVLGANFNITVWKTTQLGILVIVKGQQAPNNLLTACIANVETALLTRRSLLKYAVQDATPHVPCSRDLV